MCATEPAVVPAVNVTSPPLPSTAPLMLMSLVSVARVTPLPATELIASGPVDRTFTAPPVAFAVSVPPPVFRKRSPAEAVAPIVPAVAWKAVAALPIEVPVSVAVPAVTEPAPVLTSARPEARVAVPEPTFTGPAIIKSSPVPVLRFVLAPVRLSTVNAPLTVPILTPPVPPAAFNTVSGPADS